MGLTQLSSVTLFKLVQYVFAYANAYIFAEQVSKWEFEKFCFAFDGDAYNSKI